MGTALLELFHLNSFKFS